MATAYIVDAVRTAGGRRNGRDRPDPRRAAPPPLAVPFDQGDAVLDRLDLTQFVMHR